MAVDAGSGRVLHAATGLGTDTGRGVVISGPARDRYLVESYLPPDRVGAWWASLHRGNITLVPTAVEPHAHTHSFAPPDARLIAAIGGARITIRDCVSDEPLRDIRLKEIAALFANDREMLAKRRWDDEQYLRAADVGLAGGTWADAFRLIVQTSHGRAVLWDARDPIRLTRLEIPGLAEHADVYTIILGARMRGRRVRTRWTSLEGIAAFGESRLLTLESARTKGAVFLDLVRLRVWRADDVLGCT